MIKLISFVCLLIGFQSGCQKDNSKPVGKVSSQDNWLVNTDEILYMGLEKDRIQSIDSPAFVPIQNSILKNEELVFAVHHDGITKVYPWSVLSLHEIVNDQIGDHYYAVTFCPLTGSGSAWNRFINGKVTEFGVSGMLYRDNLIPYDRNTLSNWSQMKGICINGKLMGYEAENTQLVTTTYGLIKRAYPDALILDHEKCGDGICTPLKSGNDFGEPGDTTELPAGNTYFGIAEGESLLLIDASVFSDSIHIYKSGFKRNQLILVGDNENNYFATFIIDKNLSGINFFLLQNRWPEIMKDTTGNVYDLFGNITVGPAKGSRLSSPVFYRAHTFAWQALFSDIIIYN